MSRSLSARDIAMIAMGVALTAVCSWISIPLTVPFTMQTFAVCLVTALFGLKRGLWTVVCYMILGAVGAPVFSGFKGGISVLLGPTGGYIVGFSVHRADRWSCGGETRAARFGAGRRHGRGHFALLRLRDGLVYVCL